MSAKIPEKPAKAAKPGKDTIYIDVDDEITGIIDKVEAAKQKVVAIVLPKRSTALQSIVNMRLLKRSAEAAGKNPVLITNEAGLLPLAGAAGLHVAKNLQSKPVIPPSPIDGKETPTSLEDDEMSVEEDEIDEKDAKLDYHRSIGELAAVHSVEEPETIALDDAEETATSKKTPVSKNKRLKVPDFDRFRLLLGLGVLAFVSLIVFIILALFVLPKATIAITTSSTPVALDLNLTTSGTAKGLDEDKKIIPSVLKTSQQTATQQAQATGQQNLGQKAGGSVTLKNCTDSAVTVPAGTGVSSSGLTYITQTSTSMDAGIFDSHGNCRNTGTHIKSVNVTAQSPGTKYNIGPSNFTVSGFPGVSGSSESSMTGGTDNNVTVVSQQDVDNAKQKLTSQNSDTFSKDFQKQLSDSGLYVITATLKISEPNTTASPAVGQQASTTTVTTQINYTVLAVQKDDLKKIVAKELNKQIDPQKQKISGDDVLKGASITVENQTSPTNATLVIHEDTSAVPIIDVASVKALAKGQKKGDIQAALNGIPGIKTVDIKLSPFWVSKAPKKPGKINVILQAVKTDNNGGG